MRRIYESEALRRDETDPFSPGERDDRSGRPLEMRMVPSSWLSRRLVPHWLRHRAISIDVTTPREEYPLGTRIPFVVTMKNAMPFPITIPTRSPIFWTWDVDGVIEAVSDHRRDPPAEERAFNFDRGERKTFPKRWHQSFRVSDSEWEPAEPGEYTIGAGLNVENAEKKGLYAETTIRLVED